MQSTVSEGNSLEFWGLARWPYTRSTYKLRPITGEHRVSLVPIKISEKVAAERRELLPRSVTRGTEYRFGRHRYERVSRSPGNTILMGEYRSGIAADFTYDWIAISRGTITSVGLFFFKVANSLRKGEESRRASILIIELSSHR